ncbi:MAG: sensor domain-containing diguanylate cyclase [Sideroxydans sp.]|nr:sensor domain-containing diguanylate cyclase [Sideroxydans sp.]
MDSLEIENQLLRRQLQSLLDEARLNEKKWQHVDQLEKKLIATRALPELLQILLEDYRSDTESVTLALLDLNCEIKHILERESHNDTEIPGLVLLDRMNTDDLVPHLGIFNTDHPRAIFDPWPTNSESMMLLPLLRQGELIGTLNLASSTVGRFAADSSTDFMERLANIFSICLENSLNHERLKQVGLTDPLTGIFNRRYFETRCQEEVANVRRYQTTLTCMFLDIDKFKRINDTYGHPAGDDVLRNVARLIKAQLRSNDVLARFGGEEFVVLLPQTGTQHACEIAERIRHAISARPFHLGESNHLTVTISIGVASIKDKLVGDDMAVANNLLASADGALYLAKNGGRDQVVCEGERTELNATKRNLLSFFSFN